MMRILIAVGDSEHSQIALHQAVYLAQKVSVSATILTVVKGEEEESIGVSILQEAEDVLQTAVPHIQNLQTKIRVGHAGEQIVAEAEDDTYDLLIIGERPQHKLLTRLLGPTALRVIAHTTCPVLIAKEEPHALAKILVCDSVFAEPNLSVRLHQQLPEVLAQAEKVTLLHVMSQIAAAPGINGQQLRANANELIDVHSPEGELLNQDTQLLNRIDVVVRPIVRHGLVVDEILTEARDGRYDLIVIGAHPHEGWRRFLLEDVTAQIVLQALRPILVIP